MVDGAEDMGEEGDAGLAPAASPGDTAVVDTDNCPARGGEGGGRKVAAGGGRGSSTPSRHHRGTQRWLGAAGRGWWRWGWGEVVGWARTQSDHHQHLQVLAVGRGVKVDLVQRVHRVQPALALKWRWTMEREHRRGRAGVEGAAPQRQHWV